MGAGKQEYNIAVTVNDKNHDGFITGDEFKNFDYKDKDGLYDSKGGIFDPESIVTYMGTVGIKRTDSAIAAELLGATQNIVQLGEMSPKFKPSVENMPGGGHHIALTNFSEKYDLDLDKDNQIIAIKHTKWDASREEKTEEFKAYGGNMAEFKAAKKVLSDKLGMK